MMFWIILLFAGLYRGVSTECTARGRFPNDITEDCRGYTTCIATSDSFYRYNLACPPQFIYNHFDSQCKNATGYYCLPDYNCTKLGSYPNPDSIDCTSYVACIQALDALTARLIDCPPGTVYNPNEEFCVDETIFTCPSITVLPVVTSVIETDSSQQNVTDSSQQNVTDSSQQNVTDPTPKRNRASYNGALSLAYLLTFSIFIYSIFFKL